MTEALSPPDDREARQHLLAGADALIGRLIDLAWAILDAALPGTLIAAVRRHLVTHILVPAEAALRRALMVIAANHDTPEPVARASTPGAAPPAARPPGQPGTRPPPPRFRLIEPPVRPVTDYLPVSQRPRISIAGDPPPPPPAPRAKADPATLDTRIRRRLDALAGAERTLIKMLNAAAWQLAPGPVDTS